MTSKEVADAIESVIEILAEGTECDCPPEWPRCAACRARLRLRVIVNALAVQR